MPEIKQDWTGTIEYLSQSNNSADIVDVKDRFKFVEDLSIKAYQKIDFFENNSLTLKLICGWLSVKKQKKKKLKLEQGKRV